MIGAFQTNEKITALFTVVPTLNLILLLDDHIASQIEHHI